MARVDHRDVTYLVLERLRTQLSATMLVLAPHEAAPPGDPTHEEYASTWCRLQYPIFTPQRRNKRAEPDQWVIETTVIVAVDPRATGLAPLAIETAAHLIAAALSEYCVVNSNLTLTFENSRPVIDSEPDAETFFRTATVMTAGLAEQT